MKKSNIRIGLEVHVPLNTKSKLFCGCSTGISKPNTHVCEVCLGLPGSKPRINASAIEYAQRLAYALGCKLSEKISFTRKTYLYVDLVKNFQITQLDEPIALGGTFDLKGREIRIRRLQLEEDPGSSKHMDGYSLNDYNRSGIALIELVTEPDFERADGVLAFLDSLRSILDYLGLLRQDLAIRTDVNVSVESGARVEIKNLSGSEAIKKAIAFEIIRQKRLLEKGERVESRTMHYDADSGKTFVSRDKESEAEYGYIDEPDIPAISFSKDQLKEIEKSVPELPEKKITRLMKQYSLREEDSRILCFEIFMAETFEALAGKIDKEFLKKWMVGPLRKVLNYNGKRLADTPLSQEKIAELLTLMKEGTLSDRAGEMVLRELVLRDISVKSVITKLGFDQKEDLDSVVKEVVKENKNVAEEYKNGKEKSLHFLVGQVVRKTGGKADAKKVAEMIKKEIM